MNEQYGENVIGMNRHYQLGFDMGENSCGWAAIELDNNNEPMRILGLGSRVWTEGEYKHKSPSGASYPSTKKKFYSDTKGLRRIFKSRHERTKAIKKLLCDCGFINELVDESYRYDYDRDFDDNLEEMKEKEPMLYKYGVNYLRVIGLNSRLTNFELSYLLLYFSNHRGYSDYYSECEKDDSNKKESKTSDKENSSSDDMKALKSIACNEKSFREYRKRNSDATYGQYIFNTKCSAYWVDGKFNARNKAGSYTHSISRETLREEIKKILSSQQELGNTLITDEFIGKYIALFYNQTAFEDGDGYNIENMIGRCRFEKDESRAATTNFYAEYFIALSTLRNITLFNAYDRREYKLTYQQLSDIMNELLTSKKSFSYDALRKWLNANNTFSFGDTKELPDKKDTKKKDSKELEPLSKDVLSSIWLFKNISDKIEKPNESKTAVSLQFYHNMMDVLGFEPFSFGENGIIFDDYRDTISLVNKISFVLSRYKTKVNREKKLKEISSLSIETIKSLLPLKSNGFTNLSEKALGKILPYLQLNEPEMKYNVACERAGYDFNCKQDVSFEDKPAFITSELLSQHLENVLNPTVRYCVTQTSKLYNVIVNKFGIPYKVCFEMARDMAHTKKEKDRIQKNNIENNRNNDSIKETIADVKGISKNDVKASDILRFKLWSEQNECCLYSGKPISLEKELFDYSSCEVDHVIPRSAGGTDSYFNKVLVFKAQNQQKSSMPLNEYLSTPCQRNNAEHLSWSEFQAIINRNRMDFKKKKVLLTEHSPAEFADVMRIIDTGVADLNHTAYGNKVMIKLLSAVKHGINSKDSSKISVVCLNGYMTSVLRSTWLYRFNPEQSLSQNMLLNDVHEELASEDGGTINSLFKSKDRNDVRHHAIDAVIIGCFSPKIVNKCYLYLRKKEQMYSYFNKSTSREERDSYLKNLLFDAQPYVGFYYELAIRLSIHEISDKQKQLLVSEGFLKYPYTNKELKLIYPFCMALLTSGKSPNGKALHGDTIYSSEKGTDKVVHRVSIMDYFFKGNKLKEKKDVICNEHLIDYASDDICIENVLLDAYDKALSDKENEKSYFENLYKPSKNQEGKNRIKKIKIYAKDLSFPMNVRKGVAEGSNISYWEVWQSAETGYKLFVPVYNCQKKSKHYSVDYVMKYITDKKIEKFSRNDMMEYICNIYKYLLIRSNKTGKLFFLVTNNHISNNNFKTYSCLCFKELVPLTLYNNFEIMSVNVLGEVRNVRI